MSSSSLHGRVVLQFASNLLTRNFVEARQLLSHELAERYSEAQLELSFDRMVDYGDAPPTSTELVTEDTGLPSVTNKDSGWAYVAILGPGYSEAVSGVVTREGLIRDLEWGRP